MIPGWKDKLSSIRSGRTAGMYACAPAAGCGAASASFSPGLNRLLSYLRTAAVGGAGLALLVLLLAPSPALSLTPVQGDLIINSAQLASSNSPPATSSVTVAVAIRTPSFLEFLTYAPALPGADLVNVSTTAYRIGSAATDPFVNMPPPVPVGSTTPINLSQPVPLTAATQLLQGEPLFLRLTDRDQNLNSTLAETVLVTVSNPANGDVEVVRLTETGPNTGIFAGYLPTANTLATTYNGNLSVSEGNTVTARYVDVQDGSDTSAAALLVDPYGLVFDSGSGLPVNGATITMINTATGLPATVYGNDGVSTFPATITSGGTATDSSGVVYSFPPGNYRYPFVQPGSYQYRITPPAGYGAPSTVPTSTIQALPGAPFIIVPGSRGEVFVINPGPALRIDIPLDPAASALWMQKFAGKDIAGQGDFIPYQLTVTNSVNSTSANGISVTDVLPLGLRYRSGSAKLNGISAKNPVVSSNGQTLTFTVGTLASGAVATIDYVVEVTAGTRLGAAVNSAFATATGVKSNTAYATVTIRDDFLRSRSTLMGRVTTGACNEETGEGPNGVEGVRVYLEDGTFVISDYRGMFHFEGVRAGLHVVQMDIDSLPEGYEAFACTQNSRFAGRAFSQFVETQGGTLWRTDFHIRPKDKPAPDTAPVAQPVVVPQTVKGEIVIDLASSIDGQNIAYRSVIQGTNSPVQAARINILLPEGMSYEPGSSRMDGIALADPLLVDNTRLVYQLGDLPSEWRHELTFRAKPSRGRKGGALVTQAYLASDGDTKTRVLTPLAETSLQLDKDTEIYQMPEIVLRPHFPTLGAELNAEDLEKLDELARLLSGLRTEKIHVTGYTDNVRIATRNRGLYLDNQALSMARARSVGHYLMDKLHITPEKLSLDGKGETAPIADNSSETGRALNRRVEIRITSSRIIDRSHLRVTKAFSGEQHTETITMLAAPDANRVEQHTAIQSAPAKGQAMTAVVPAVLEKPATLPQSDAVLPRSDLSDTKGTPASDGPAAASASPATATTLPVASSPDAQATTIKDREGILSPGESDIIINRINGIRVCLDSKLTPRLLVDNKEIPADRIGFTMKDVKAGKTIYSYIGVDLGDRGDHVVQFQGIDPFGNTRFNQTISVKRSGEIVSIRLKSAEGNVADGMTPVRLKLELYDADGTLIPAGADLEIREGTLQPLKLKDLFSVFPAAGSFEQVQMTRDGDVLFKPVNNSGLYRVVLGYNSATVEAETYVQPKLRDWILVGLAEGTMGYNTVSGNMEALQGTDLAEDFQKDGRIAFFAKGQIQGKWLLTMAYDTDKTKSNSGDRLFQTINPESYYTLYGDASQQQYDAASTKKLYLRIEREQFYAMFGDFDTGLTVTELSRYSRRMTGVKTELQTGNFEVNAFGSETEQAYVRDQIPGDGTSGIYRLSRRNIVPNSEKIIIEVRDRFRSEIVVSSQTLNRFADYSIDFQNGTVIFKEPIHNRDLQLNPITIVAEYETVATGGQNYTYGGRAGVKLLDQRLKVGGTYIHEDQGALKGNLYGMDTSYKLNQSTKLRAEYATTEVLAGPFKHNANAYLAEVSHTSKMLDARAYIREQETGFGLGQQSRTEAGTRKYGVEGAYRFNDNLNTTGLVYRQYNLQNNATRDVGEAKLNYTDKRHSVSLGLLGAQDHLADGSNHRSTQLTLGGKYLTLYERLTLTLDHAQSIMSNSNSDFPTRTVLGAEFMATRNLTLLAAQEFTWGAGAMTQNTRLGMRSTPWSGAAMTSSVERMYNENDDRVFALVGLKQTWQINEAWKVDAGLDRSQTVYKAAYYQFDRKVPPASGGRESFTAVSGGANYQIKQLTWDNRLEYRKADSENKWGLMSGVVNEVDNQWAWSGRALMFQTAAVTGIDTTKANLRYGLVFRPPQTKWIVLNRLDYLYELQKGGLSPSFTSWRLVNNLIANFRPRKDLQISLQYGAKYVRENINSSSYTGFTDHIGFESRYDVTKAWDIGMRGSLLHSWHGGQYQYSCGLSTGYNIFENAWVSVGYNIFGFEDNDFSSAAYTSQGPYVRFRMRFDQQSVKDAATWINKQ